MKMGVIGSLLLKLLEVLSDYFRYFFGEKDDDEIHPNSKLTDEEMEDLRDHSDPNNHFRLEIGVGD